MNATLLIRLLARRRRVGVDPFVHRADHPVDGETKSIRFPTAGGKRRLALANRRTVPGSSNRSTFRGSPGRPVQPHLHGAGGSSFAQVWPLWTNRPPGSSCAAREETPAGDGAASSPPQGQIHSDASEYRDQDEKD